MKILKNKVLGFLFLITAYLSAIPEILTRTVCKHSYAFCGLPYIWQTALCLYIISIFGVYLFTHSYQAIGHPWRKVMKFFVPITLLLILTTSPSPDDWLGPDIEEITFFISYLYIGLTTIILLVSAIFYRSEHP
jgi:hypothetical protein